MRVAATDYDGTLFLRGSLSPETLAAIRQWRAAGNIFGIVTGRDRSMLRHEVLRWSIPADFFVCCSGAALYGPTFDELRRHTLADGLARAVLEHPAALDSAHYQMMSGGASYLYLRNTDSPFPDLDFPYTPISLDEALAMTGLQQISLSYQTEEQGKTRSAMLNASFAGRLRAHQNKNNIDITAHGVNKAGGIEEILELNGWPEQGILVIGDSSNDAPMIRRFSGFAVAGADESARREAQAVFPDVGAMLLHYL